MKARRSTLLAVLTSALVLALALTPSVAWAHSALESASPAPESRVQAAPGTIVLNFSEPFNRSLTTVHLFDSDTELETAVTVTAANSRRLVVTPDGLLPTASYRIEWHTVANDDGHVLEGSYGFGVRTAPTDPLRLVARGPFAGAGSVRIAFRTIMFVALFLFAGGVLVPVVLRTRGPMSAWLLPASAYRDHTEGDSIAARLQGRTVRAGWIALAAAGSTALMETWDAGGAITPGTLKGYLLTNIAGLSRVATMILLLAATLQMGRRRRFAAAAVVLAFLAVAVGGHANSASPRWLAIVTDWIHLVAAAVWAGGIAQIALAWVPGLNDQGRGARMAAVRQVLPRFGVVALPAFIVVAVSGSLNALLQVGAVSAMLNSSYGQVLTLKVVIVGAMALLSYQHAIRLRPRLLARTSQTHSLEQRHWRLLGGEAGLAAVVLMVVAVLVAFPLPPRQLTDADHGKDEAPQPYQIARAPHGNRPTGSATSGGSSVKPVASLALGQGTPLSRPVGASLAAWWGPAPGRATRPRSKV